MVERQFGELLRALREDRGRSKRWVAQHASEVAPDIQGVTRTALRQWENESDGRIPNLAQLHVLAMVLGLSLAEQDDLLRAARTRVASRAAALRSARPALDESPSVA